MRVTTHLSEFIIMGSEGDTYTPLHHRDAVGVHAEERSCRNQGHTRVCSQKRRMHLQASTLPAPELLTCHVRSQLGSSSWTWQTPRFPRCRPDRTPRTLGGPRAGNTVSTGPTRHAGLLDTGLQTGAARIHSKGDPNKAGGWGGTLLPRKMCHRVAATSPRSGRSAAHPNTQDTLASALRAGERP